MAGVPFQPRELSVRTVPLYWERRQEIFAATHADLSELRILDSAAVAFLVQWAKSHGEDFHLTLGGAPAQLQGLIRTFNLERMFVVTGDAGDPA